MKAFLTVKNNQGLKSDIDDRFGRAAYFVIYDMDKDEIVSIEENTYKNQNQGVGVAVCNHIIKTESKLAIGAQPGPKASAILHQGQIEFFMADSCTVAEAIKKYREKQQQ